MIEINKIYNEDCYAQKTGTPSSAFEYGREL